MGRFGAISLILILFIGGHAFAVEDPTLRTLQAYLNTDTSLRPTVDAFTQYISHLEKKQASFKSEREFLRYIFNKTHQKFLKHYEPYASFGDLLKTGKYNCLTGTALYSLLLDHFGIQYTTIETNYHIFILTTVTGKPILLETTDPLMGFISNEKDIAEKLATYRTKDVPNAVSSNQLRYEFSFNLWQAVSLQELTGLLYFNQATKAYNHQQLTEASFFLVQAGQYYPSKRIEEFSALVITTILESTLADELKKQLIAQLKQVQKQSTQVMSASLNH